MAGCPESLLVRLDWEPGHPMIVFLISVTYPHRELAQGTGGAPERGVEVRKDFWGGVLFQFLKYTWGGNGIRGQHTSGYSDAKSTLSLDCGFFFL